MSVTSKIRFLLKSSDSILLFTCWVCPCKLHNWLVHCSCYYCRCCLSCIRSELAKQYPAIHERFGHVRHPSLKRVASHDSTLFLMSVYKTSHSLAHCGFCFPDCVVVSFCKSPHHSWCCFFCWKLSQGDPTAQRPIALSAVWVSSKFRLLFWRHKL